MPIYFIGKVIGTVVATPFYFIKNVLNNFKKIFNTGSKCPYCGASELITTKTPTTTTIACKQCSRIVSKFQTKESV